MPDNYLFDRHQLQYLMDRAGMNQTDLACRIGLNKAEISKLVRGKSTNPGFLRVAKIASALDASPADFYAAPLHGSHWVHYTTYDLDEVKKTQSRLAEGDYVLEFTQGMKSYLQPPKLHAWTFQQAQSSNGWDDATIKSVYKKIIRPSSEHQTQCRNDGKFNHYVMAPIQFFRLAFRHDGDWCSDVTDLLCAREDHTRVGFVDDGNWQAATKIVRTVLFETGGFPTCENLTIVDDNMAVVRTSREQESRCQHRPTVRRLRSVLKTLTPYVSYLFCPTMPVSSDDRSLKHAIKLLEKTADTCKKIDLPPDQQVVHDRKFWRALGIRSLEQFKP